MRVRYVQRWLRRDRLIHDLQDKYDALIIPGGLKGAEALSQSTEVQTLVREYYEGNKIVAMICAGALTPWGYTADNRIVRQVHWLQKRLASQPNR